MHVKILLMAVRFVLHALSRRWIHYHANRRADQLPPVCLERKPDIRVTSKRLWATAFAEVNAKFLNQRLSYSSGSLYAIKS